MLGTYPWCTQSRREAQVSHTRDFFTHLQEKGENLSCQQYAGHQSKQRYLERVREGDSWWKNHNLRLDLSESSNTKPIMLW